MTPWMLAEPRLCARAERFLETLTIVPVPSRRLRARTASAALGPCDAARWWSIRRRPGGGERRRLSPPWVIRWRAEVRIRGFSRPGALAGPRPGLAGPDPIPTAAAGDPAPRSTPA